MLENIIEKISSATLQKDPFSYFFISGIFPQAFYQELLDQIPLESFRPLSEKGAILQGTYPQRFSFPLSQETVDTLPFFQSVFWTRLVQDLSSALFITTLLRLFSGEYRERFGEKNIGVCPDLGLVSDHSNFGIGPHTDHPQKILTLLFYLPHNKEQKHLGTSVYVPLDPQFRCEGYKHHPFEGFKKVYTAPFLPNSLFGFFKSDRSFHGVEEVGTLKTPRNLLSYQLMWEP